MSFTTVEMLRRRRCAPPKSLAAGPLPEKPALVELTAADRAHFEDCGWVRVPGAFASEDAAAMRDVEPAQGGPAPPRVCEYLCGSTPINTVVMDLCLSSRGRSVLGHP